jgi:peptidoglycan-associated lipoprotein
MNAKGLLYGVTLLSLLSWGGCASAPARQAAGPGAAASASQPSTPAGKGPAAARDTIREATSLEAAQRGQTTATPAESPLKEIYFDFDRYDLRADARETLKANAAWLKSNPAARVEIEGHADERGTNEYNLALGAKRAQSAKDYLVTLGVSAERLSTISYGEELPVCREQNEGCWQKNRRAKFVVTTGRPAS